ncbi:hypothetical protein BN7_2654 [Wickerhamomyces ciferrii]|uniref:AAA+ ATPase domain-containing protein n=1 Tax=Wickerhamomyces ciferrii (strain ATCC 14091 / BCRC 22168 / CBS 111 / JCM 3599 / NBRC 0793 / NRRL Y-1031 F-60-10) TaxID=1206466 RepID=K0KLL2_WICCF|nr:uncharacterized protein BN7_2654 [Wickerhamomyces ciferrii]CCH43107.1 hypothetical protein BN7_2654 [Wickerhamomyces ciferrii]
MNFIRKKPSAPLDDLTELYNETANRTIYNLALEQKNEIKRAVQGWKSLHTHVLYKLDLINKAFEGYSYTADEISLREGIEELNQKGLKHLERVTRLQSPYDSSTLRPNLVQKPSSSTYSVPTLRSHSPHNNSSSNLNNTQSQQQTSRMLKTLRPDKGHKFNSKNNYNTKQPSSELSKIAATKLYNQPATVSKSQNWSTSKSLTQQQQYQHFSNSNSSSPSNFNRNSYPENIFDQSFDDAEFDLKFLKRNDTLSQLEAMGQQSQLSRSKTNDDHVTSQFEKINLDDYDSPRNSYNQIRSTPNLIDIKSPFDDPTTSDETSTNSSPKKTPPAPPPSRPPIPKTTPLPTLSPKPPRPEPIPKTSTATTSHKLPNASTSARTAIKPKTPISQAKKATQPLKSSLPTKSTPSTASSTTRIGTRPTAAKASTTSAPGTTRRVIPTTKAAATTRTTAGTASATKPTAKSSTTTTTQAARRAAKTTTNNPAANTRPQGTRTTTTAKPTAKPTTTTKAKTSIPKPKSRSRSQSPVRDDTKDTETIESNEESEEFADESQLTEKEIREKMEEQIISEIRGIDHGAAKQIFNEIVVHGDEVHWDDIAGLETAKNSLKETVVYPFLRPDLFSGLREPARGMLLFGPPGTGKTMLARAVATESRSTFFSISASSLTSKFLGESEKLVRALFMLAKKLSPAIIFVDEIDSLLSSRNEGGEHESSRRIKNEFLIQWSDLTHAAAGKDTGEDLQRVLVLAATNLPWAIDEAARRRFVRRQYIPLPEPETRQAQIIKLLAHQKHTLDEKDQLKLVEMLDGFSGSDITALAKDAAMGPLRSLGDKLLSTSRDEIRPINLEDFINSLKYIRPSVSKENLGEFEDWASKYGSSGV